MGASYINMGYTTKSNESFKKAFDHVQYLSKREQYIVKGDFYRWREQTLGKAIEAYNTLLDLYPDDGYAHYHLGIIYNGLEEWGKAIKHFEYNIKNKDESYFPYFSISRSCRAKGLFEKAREHLNIISNIFRIIIKSEWLWQETI
jgi:tetratricopeptide (TPR) repeat protein